MILKLTLRVNQKNGNRYKRNSHKELWDLEKENNVYIIIKSPSSNDWETIKRNIGIL